jgi:penicillin-binding protein 1B
MQVGPERLTHLINVLAGLKAEANPAVILGSTDQSPYGMTQLYQFLASGGEIQPLHAVRGVVDAQGKLLKRYDKSPAPAQEGDSIAANLISVGLQQVVASGTAARLNAEGLSHLQAAGKTGTSNDGRDSWYAGYTGDHLAVIWMGNDQNEQTGLFGASGAMRVWSGIFRNLPSKPLRVNNKGLDWQYVDANGNNATDEGCPGARRFPFVVGFAPAYAPCSPPAEAVPDAGEGGSEGGGWRSWFGLDRKAPEPASTPASETPAR